MFCPNNAPSDRNDISLIAVTVHRAHIPEERIIAMTAHVLQFIELSDEDRKQAARIGKLGKADGVEVRIKSRTGADQIVSLPPPAAAVIETLLSHLYQGECVAILTKDQE